MESILLGSVFFLCTLLIIMLIVAHSFKDAKDARQKRMRKALNHLAWANASPDDTIRRYEMQCAIEILCVEGDDYGRFKTDYRRATGKEWQ